MQYTGNKWLVHFHLPMIPIALMSKPRRANNGRLKKSSVSFRNGWKNSNTEDTWNQESQQTAIKKRDPENSKNLKNNIKYSFEYFEHH